MSDYKPRHRKNALVRKWPRLQNPGKHIGQYVPEDRTHERLGAEAFDLRDLMQETFTGNPFRGRS